MRQVLEVGKFEILRSKVGNVFHNKRGVIFTLLALLLVGILGLTVVIMQSTPARQQSAIVEFDTLNSFINDLEHTILPRILVSSTYAGLNYLSREMTEFFDLKGLTALQELLEGKLVGGTAWADDERLLWSSSDPQKGAFGKLRTTALQQLPLKSLTFTRVHDVKISQLDAWTAQVEMQVDYKIESLSGTMNWTRADIPVTAKMSLLGLIDPFVRLCTKSPGVQLVRVFNQTLPPPDELPNSWTAPQYAAYFDNIIGKRLYVTKSTAPDILDRFNGDNRKSDFGVYSIIGQSWGRTGLIDVGDPYADYCLIGTPVAASDNINTAIAPAKCSKISSALYRAMCGNSQTGNAVTDEIAGLADPALQGKLRLDEQERVRFHLEPTGNRCVYDDASARWVNPGTTPLTDCN